MNIGEKIKRERERIGLTQTDLGNKCGTSKQTIYKYEMGIITNIPLDKLQLIAAALGVDPAYLTGWNGEEWEVADELQPMTEKEAYAEELFRDPSLRMLFSAAKGARKEDLELAAQMLRRMKRDAGYDD